MDDASPKDGGGPRTAVMDDTRTDGGEGQGWPFFYLWPLHSSMATITRNTSTTFTTKEVIMSYAQIISIMNLLGIDTAGAGEMNLRVVRENNTFLGLLDGDLNSGDLVNFSFQEVEVDVDQTEVIILDVDFSPPPT